VQDDGDFKVPSSSVNQRIDTLGFVGVQICSRSELELIFHKADGELDDAEGLSIGNTLRIPSTRPNTCICEGRLRDECHFVVELSVHECSISPNVRIGNATLAETCCQSDLADLKMSRCQSDFDHRATLLYTALSH